MLKFVTIPILLVAASSLAIPAQACDMHGGGFSFGSPNANWQSYSPRSSIVDPAFLGFDSDEVDFVTTVPAEKARPSFSSAANRAALIAKARVARKAKEEADKTTDDKPVKKTTLISDSDR